MYNFIFAGLIEFAEKHDLEFSCSTRKRIDGITIVKFVDKSTSKHINIVLNVYDRLNLSDKEIIKNIIDEVEVKLLRKKEIK